MNMKVWSVLLCLGINLFVFAADQQEGSLIDSAGMNLCSAIKECDLANCKTILDQFPDKQELASRCLPYAAWVGNESICRLLLRYGADPNAYKFCEYTALQSAVKFGCYDLCELFLAYGVDVDAPFCVAGPENGLTPLDCAAINQQYKLCKLLIFNFAETRVDFAYGTPKIIKLVKMAQHLKLAKEGKIFLPTLKLMYLHTLQDSWDNVGLITKMVRELWGAKSSFLQQLWDLYDSTIRDSLFIKTGLKGLKRNKITTKQFCEHVLVGRALNAHIQEMVAFVRKANDKNFTKKLNEAFASLKSYNEKNVEQ